nr:cytokinin dehydrogenase 3-like [Ipomoea batatas]
MSIVGEVKTWNPSLPYEILSLDFAARLSFSPDSVAAVSGDFGWMVTGAPAAVLYPATAGDVVELIEFSYNSSSPFARNGGGIRVSWSEALGFYADVGGYELWVDVLRASLEYGLAPVSWTDYLYLTVGGTPLQRRNQRPDFPVKMNIFFYNDKPQTPSSGLGKGEFITCSKHINSELFFAVLGGLGQFGVITRARIVLNKAPTRVKWVRMLYDDFTKFTRDQEHLISIDDGLDYVEGSLVMNQSPANNWRSSFFSPSHQPQIASLISHHGIIYSLEVVKYYDDETAPTIDEELQELFKGLSFIPGFVFEKDVSFFDFLNRVRSGEVKLRQKGLWDVPHPWLNLFVPKSRILDFNVGVFVDIILRQNKTSGPILVYPTNKSRWDDRMSAVIPEEETFYCVGLLHSSGVNEWGELDSQNEEILKYCDEAGIKIKQYLPHYKTEEDWENHFGKKWKTFQQRKALFDPKLILSPGQRIFS